MGETHCFTSWLALNRSPSLDCQMSASSSTLSAHASSGSRRSFDSWDPLYNDDLFHKLSYLPQDSSLSRRILSESRLHTRPSRRVDYEVFSRQSEDNLGKVFICQDIVKNSQNVPFLFPSQVSFLNGVFTGPGAGNNFLRSYTTS